MHLFNHSIIHHSKFFKITISMKHLCLILLVLLGFTSACQTSATGAKSSAAAQDTRFYEMRVYYAAPGKLADLHNRFRTNTTRIFEKQGMTNIGYWEPIDNPD